MIAGGYQNGRRIGGIGSPLSSTGGGRTVDVDAVNAFKFALKNPTKNTIEDYDSQWCSVRFGVIGLLSFLGFLNIYALRVNLSVAMVAMINQTSSQSDASECKGDTPKPTVIPPGHDQGAPVYNWDEGLVLGAFFYGYLFTQLPGGWLAERIGGKRLIGYGVLLAATLTLLTPLVATFGQGAFVVLRFMEGLAEGVTFPAMNAMWSKWAPPLERSRLVVFSLSGCHFGTFVTMPIAGLLCRHGFSGGWPSVFYVFGMLAILWCIPWMIFASDTPQSSHFISAQERHYIEDKIGSSATDSPIAFGDIPWHSMLRSMPLWAIIVGDFCMTWGFYTMLTCLPTFMKNVLNFDISQSGIVSALPYAVMFMVTVTTSYVVDSLRESGRVSTTVARKACHTIGLATPAFCLYAVGYTGCDYVTAVALLTIGVGFSGVAWSGCPVNILDIAPRFGGTLTGIVNTAATVPGILGPMVVAHFTQHHETFANWRIVFFITVVVYFVGILFYLTFASGEEQEWAKSSSSAVKRSNQRVLSGSNRLLSK